MRLLSACWVLLVLIVDAENEVNRKQKTLSVFTVVKFPNSVCLSSTTGRNGTCYTNSECTAKGGSASGSCASGFGSCCIFEKSCGGGSVAGRSRLKRNSFPSLLLRRELHLLHQHLPHHRQLLLPHYLQVQLRYLSVEAGL